MSLVATLEALAAAGGTTDQLIAVVKAHEAAKADALAARRAHDAARQKTHRAKKNNVTSREHNVTGRDSRDPSPRARVSDYITNSENNLPVVVGVDENRETDDWPTGDLARTLANEVASPWLDLDKTGKLITTSGLIASWKRAGASWRHDVIPVVRGMLANRREPVSSWKFFEAQMARQIAENRRALEIPEASAIIPFRQVGPPSSYAEKSAAAWDYALERIAEDG